MRKKEHKVSKNYTQTKDYLLDIYTGKTICIVTRKFKIKKRILHVRELSCSHNNTPISVMSIHAWGGEAKERGYDGRG